MPTYQKASQDVLDCASLLIKSYSDNEELAGVKIDYVFALPSLDADGEPIGDAITHHGMPALGLCRIVSLKDRAKGNGDAEILLDQRYWEASPDAERAALLDHELHHLQLKRDKKNRVRSDDLGRPRLTMRKHDRQFGWFDAIARRHGPASAERRQAREIFTEAGQLYWPTLTDPDATQVTLSTTGGKSVTVPLEVLHKVSAGLARDRGQA